MSKAARWEIVLARLAEEGEIDVVSLADELGCSPSTVRRDLRELGSKNLLFRVHGGAVSTGILYEMPLDYRAGQRQDEKRWIAIESASRIEPGMVIGITGGTTCAAMARQLINRQLTDVTVVTNSLAIAQDFVLHTNYRLFVTGGFVRPASMELVGSLPELTMPKINLDVIFLGADGVAADTGLTVYNDLEARTDEIFMHQARTRIVLADSTKLGRAVFAQICPLKDVHALITSVHAPAEAVAGITAQGLEVTLAGPVEGADAALSLVRTKT